MGVAHMEHKMLQVRGVYLSRKNTPATLSGLDRVTLGPTAPMSLGILVPLSKLCYVSRRLPNLKGMLWILKN